MYDSKGVIKQQIIIPNDGTIEKIFFLSALTKIIINHLSDIHVLFKNNLCEDNAVVRELPSILYCGTTMNLLLCDFKIIHIHIILHNCTQTNINY